MAGKRIVGLALLLLVAGCASRTTRAGPEPGIADVREGWSETGVASWYGEHFHGRRTASGEVYDMEAPTAAHRTLPFGTRVRVENLDNGRSVELVVNDRGPFARGRILDVSRWGARRLDMIGPGTARVRVTVLEAGSDLLARRGGCVFIQLAALRDRAVAEGRREELSRAGYPAEVEHADGWFRVLAGPYRSEAAALEAHEALGGFVRRCRM